MSGKVLNPNGKKGNKDHQLLIEKIWLKLLDLFPEAKKEGKIDLKNGKSRYADIVAIDKNKNLAEIHQVGRTNKNGSPVSRERKAIADIEQATGLKVIFHALKVIIVSLLITAIVYLIVN